MNVIRRRHFVTHGSDLIGLDDEVFDAGAASEAGFQIVGEGALLAALDQERTGRMHDIVATIQSEQDEAIRSDLAGVLVVAGGAGTGKTAVALHRAAYLLYTYRRQLQNQGVLLLGPSPVFLRYIEEVLPSLGEHEVHLATLATLRPEARPRATEPTEVAAVKGDMRMERVIRKAVADRQHVLPRNINLLVDGLALRISRRDSSRIVGRAKRRRGTHNARRPYVAALLVDVLVRRYRNAAAARRTASQPLFEPDADEDGSPLLDPTVAGALARGEAPPPEWEAELRQKLRRRPEVREALERMWPVLTGAELVRDLFGFPALIHSASAGVLTAAGGEAAVPAPHGAPRRHAVGRGRRRAGRRGRGAARPGRGGPVAAAAAAAGWRRPRPCAPRPASSRRWGSRGTPTPRRSRPASATPEVEAPPAGERAADLRPRARRRGPGPHADAVADGRAAGAVGFAEPRRRLRAGEPARRRRPAGTASSTSSDPAPAPGSCTSP